MKHLEFNTVEEVKRARLNGLNIHEMDDYVLKYAIMTGRLDIVEYILSVETFSTETLTQMLKLSYDFEQFQISICLTNKGADANLVNQYILIDKLKKFDDIAKEHGSTDFVHTNDEMIFRQAAENGELIVVKHLVEKYNVDIHARNDYALRWAIEADHFDVALYLLEKGADLSKYDGDLASRAINKTHSGFLNYLFDKKIIKLSDIKNHTVIEAAKKGHWSFIKSLIDRGLSASLDDNYLLLIAIKQGNLSMVKYLIEECNVDPHHDEEYALRRAAEYGQLDIVKYLVNEHDCDIKVRNKHALRLAKWRGHKNIVKYIKKIT